MAPFKLSAIFGRRGKEAEPKSQFPIDPTVEALDDMAFLNLTRQLMTLSRRWDCATAHLDLGMYYAGEEERDNGMMTSWYIDNGHKTQEERTALMANDLNAVTNDPAQVSQTLKRRIILTDCFTGRGLLEDHYQYGDINPFLFDSKGCVIGLRDTFYDRMAFPQRVETIIGLDPEIRGHRHQIRYMRALLGMCSLANLLNKTGVSNEATKLITADFRAFALGWVTAAGRIKEMGLDLSELPPDNSLLYNTSKVYQSAEFFMVYSAVLTDLFIPRR